MRNSLGTLR